MSINKVFVHTVWVTKSRKPLITPKLKPALLQHINVYANKKAIKICEMDCVQDHIHILFLLPSDMPLSGIIHLMKGESAHWVNENKIVEYHFQWQGGFYAASVSSRNIPSVIRYIKNQESHHRSQTFKEEIEEQF
jgi:putative transposase